MGTQNPSGRNREVGTHYYDDGCQPPHTDPTLPSQDVRAAEEAFRATVAGRDRRTGDAVVIDEAMDPSYNPPSASLDPSQVASKGPTDYRDQARSILTSHAGLEDNDHGVDTPQRFLDLLTELTWHRHCDGSCIKFRTFPNDGMDEMIVVQGIPFVSVCNHHIVPFIGHAHVAYVPKDEIVGLSKFARVVDHFARALQVQERLTAQVADYIEEHLSPRGVGVVLQAEHLCMTIRGVQKPGALTTTAAMKGVFSDHARTAKAEFMRYLRNGAR